MFSGSSRLISAPHLCHTSPSFLTEPGRVWTHPETRDCECQPTGMLCKRSGPSLSKLLCVEVLNVVSLSAIFCVVVFTVGYKSHTLKVLCVQDDNPYLREALHVCFLLARIVKLCIWTLKRNVWLYQSPAVSIALAQAGSCFTHNSAQLSNLKSLV